MPIIQTKEALKFGWARTQDNLAFWWPATLLSGAAGAASFLGGRLPSLFGPPLWIVQLVLGTIFTVGLLRAGVLEAEGRRPQLGDLFSGWTESVGFLVTGLLYSVVVGIGTILFLVPGAVWTAEFLFASHFAAERGLGPIAAMKASSAITKGVKWELLIFSSAVALLNLLGALFLGVGLFLTVPISLIAAGEVYRQLCARSGVPGVPGMAGLPGAPGSAPDHSSVFTSRSP